MPMAVWTCPILKLRRHLLPPVSPGRGNPINTSQGCVAYIKTCCACAMSGRRYAIIHSVPPAYCLTPSPAASWNWFAGACVRTQVGPYKPSSISPLNHRPFRSRILPHVLWTSEAEQYHGERRTDMAKECLLPYECMVFGSTH